MTFSAIWVVRLIRYASLDILRGIAISAMVIADTPAIISKYAFMPFCGVIALPFFLICSGISYEFYIDSRLRRGLAKNELSIETIFRVVVLLIIAEISLFEGYILYPGHFKFGFYWGVFQIIAAGYLFGIFLKRNMKLEFISIMIIFLLYYICNTFSLSILNFFLIGPFPVLPYLAYFFAGRMAFNIYSLNNRFSKKDLLWLSGVMLILFLLSMLLLNYKFNTFYASRTDIIMFSLLCGIFALLTTIMHIYADNKEFKNNLLKPFERIGKIAFSSYYIYNFIELAIMPFINSNYLIHYSKLQLSMIYPIIIISIIISLSIVEKYWSKSNYKFGIEWLWRNCVKFMLLKLKLHGRNKTTDDSS